MTRSRVRHPDYSTHRALFTGQSWLATPAGDPGDRPFPYVLMSRRRVPFANLGVPGAAWATLDDVDPAKIEKQTTSDPAAYIVLVMAGGITDLLNDTTGSALYDICSAYADEARVRGVDYIIATTVPDVEDYTAGQRTEKDSHNTLLLADADAAFDAVVDVAAAPLDDWTDTTYFDHTESPVLHPTQAGADLVADRLASAMDTALA